MVRSYVACGPTVPPLIEIVTWRKWSCCTCEYGWECDDAIRRIVLPSIYLMLYVLALYVTMQRHTQNSNRRGKMSLKMASDRDVVLTLINEAFLRILRIPFFLLREERSSLLRGRPRSHWVPWWTDKWKPDSFVPKYFTRQVRKGHPYHATTSLLSE